MILLFSSLAVMFTLAGAAIVLRFGGLNKKFLSRTLAYSSGILISVSFLDIFPSAWAINQTNLSLGALGMMLVLFMTESFTILNSCSEYGEECPVHSMGTFAFIALSLHSLMDGFNIAVGFSTGTVAGVNVALGVILHKFADGVALAALLLRDGKSSKRTMYMSLALAAATPLGAGLMTPLLHTFDPDTMAILLGISGGSFLYIAMAGILPDLHKVNDRVAPWFYPLGYLTVFIMNRLG